MLAQWQEKLEQGEPEQITTEQLDRYIIALSAKLEYVQNELAQSQLRLAVGALRAARRALGGSSLFHGGSYERSGEREEGERDTSHHSEAPSFGDVPFERPPDA